MSHDTAVWNRQIRHDVLYRRIITYTIVTASSSAWNIFWLMFTVRFIFIFPSIPPIQILFPFIFFLSSFIFYLLSINFHFRRHIVCLNIFSWSHRIASRSLVFSSALYIISYHIISHVLHLHAQLFEQFNSQEPLNLMGPLKLSTIRIASWQIMRHISSTPCLD